MPLPLVQLRAAFVLPPVTATLVFLVSAVAVMQSYMRERAARMRFLDTIALDSARRERAVAAERRREAQRFERSFGYICESHARGGGGGQRRSASRLTSAMHVHIKSNQMHFLAQATNSATRCTASARA
jgi:hypothetical protein